MSEFFGCEACGILAPPPAIEPAPPAFKDSEVSNHWITTEVSKLVLNLKITFFFNIHLNTSACLRIINIFMTFTKQKIQYWPTKNS